MWEQTADLCTAKNKGSKGSKMVARYVATRQIKGSNVASPYRDATLLPLPATFDLTVSCKRRKKK
jgi:hypothetical protein